MRKRRNSFETLATMLEEGEPSLIQAGIWRLTRWRGRGWQRVWRAYGNVRRSLRWLWMPLVLRGVMRLLHLWWGRLAWHCVRRAWVGKWRALSAIVVHGLALVGPAALRAGGVQLVRVLQTLRLGVIAWRRGGSARARVLRRMLILLPIRLVRLLVVGATGAVRGLEQLGLLLLLLGMDESLGGGGLLLIGRASGSRAVCKHGVRS
jgi:hypothetical protein